MAIKGRRWIALFSQTGSELQQIMEDLQVEPDYIFTTNPNPQLAFNVRYGTKDAIHAWLRRELRPEDVITLHGYLYILPEDICSSQGHIFNGHPGYIKDYPELRGRDPQQKVIDTWESYESVGCVIHEVTGDVDCGEILASIQTPKPSEPHSLFEHLHTLSVALWKVFLGGYLGC